ncbi:hypothetical protein RBH26_13600 [Natronolimnohabitans sp. A-GB9]|uniref:hypothetical protein n=1 Tax=Natronolimnohabitans sp. A-GB9 TaxID=3069757 RepID=UPI0027B32FC6|nr:hypothetical protein [Natronolimnohabitans sp. A-GB9]MDQ2051512.1 hypothetical protein [Natronolimnohabitans sp. A-GB9]
MTDGGNPATLDGRRYAASLRRAATSPATVVTYALLVVPFAIGWHDASLFSPLALPGYLLFTVGTAIGNAVAPRFEFWLYWLPFLAGSYGVAVAVGFGYERWFAATTDSSVRDGDAN